MAQNDPQWPILPLKWLRLARNGQFWSIFNFFQVFPQKAAHIDSKWPVSQFTTFPIFSHQTGSCLAKSQFFRGGTLAKFSQICNFLNCFQLQWLKIPTMANFATKVAQLAQNCQFWSIFNFSQVSPQKVAQIDLEWLISPNSQVFQSFPTKAAHFWPNLKIFHFWGRGTLNLCHVKSAINKEAIGLMAHLSI